MDSSRFSTTGLKWLDPRTSPVTAGGADAGGACATIEARPEPSTMPMTAAVSPRVVHVVACLPTAAAPPSHESRGQLGGAAPTCACLNERALSRAGRPSRVF